MNDFQTRLAKDMYDVERAHLARMERELTLLTRFAWVDIIIGELGIVLMLVTGHFVIAALFVGIIVMVWLILRQKRQRVEAERETLFNLPDLYVQLVASPGYTNITDAAKKLIDGYHIEGLGLIESLTVINETVKMEAFEQRLRDITDQNMANLKITKESA